jgi:hypothetical protein
MAEVGRAFDIVSLTGHGGPIQQKVLPREHRVQEAGAHGIGKVLVQRRLGLVFRRQEAAGLEVPR